MRNLRFTNLKLKGWRKIAISTWRAPVDPTVYGSVEINATLLLERLQKIKEREATVNLKAPSITAILSRVVALTMHKHRGLNGMLRMGSKLSLREHVTLFLQTAMDNEGDDLSGVLIECAETKTLGQIAQEIQERAQRVRTGKDAQFNQTKKTFNALPRFLVRPLLHFLSFLIYDLNLNLSFLGLPRDPFGSVMITSIGSLGLEEAYAPLISYSRVPLLIAIGAIAEKPCVVNGKILPVPMMKLCISFDHRFIDGVYGAKMVKTARSLLESEEGLNEVGLT